MNFVGKVARGFKDFYNEINIVWKLFEKKNKRKSK